MRAGLAVDRILVLALGAAIVAAGIPLTLSSCATIPAPLKPPCQQGWIDVGGVCLPFVPPPPPTTLSSPPASPPASPPSTLPPSAPPASPPATPKPSPSAEPPVPETARGGVVEDGGPEAPSLFSRPPGPGLRDDVNGAIDEACGGCAGGSTVSDWQTFLAAVRVGLAKRGYTTNYDWDHGDLDLATGKRFDSELSIWKGCRVESYQLVTSAQKVRRPPGAYRSWGAFKDCQAVGACPLQLPLAATYELRLELTKGQPIDASPYLWSDVGPMPPPGWTGNCRIRPNGDIKRCDIGPDKDFQHGLDCSKDLCGDHVEYSVDAGAVFDWKGLDHQPRAGEPEVPGYKAKWELLPGRTQALITGKCPKVPTAEAKVVVP